MDEGTQISATVKGIAVQGLYHNIEGLDCIEVTSGDISGTWVADDGSIRRKKPTAAPVEREVTFEEAYSPRPNRKTYDVFFRVEVGPGSTAREINIEVERAFKRRGWTPIAAQAREFIPEPKEEKKQ